MKKRAFVLAVLAKAGQSASYRGDRLNWTKC